MTQTESLPVVEQEVEIFSVCLVEAEQSSPSLHVLLPSCCDHKKGLEESPQEQYPLSRLGYQMRTPAGPGWPVRGSQDPSCKRRTWEGAAALFIVCLLSLV